MRRTHSCVPRRRSCRRQGAFSVKRLRRIALLLLIVLVLGAALWMSLQLPYRGFAAEAFVKFERGSGTVSMARALEQEGVIRYAWLFWIERALHPSTKLTAGEYKFQDAASVSAIFNRIAHGDVYYFGTSPFPRAAIFFDIARTCRGRRSDARARFPHRGRKPHVHSATSTPRRRPSKVIFSRPPIVFRTPLQRPSCAS